MTIVLDAAGIAALAASPAVVAEFPFLARRPGPGGGACCGKKRAAVPDWRAAARAVLELPPERRAVFKSVTGATAVRGTVVKAGRSTQVEW